MSSHESQNLDTATLAWIDHFAPYGVIATDRDLQVQRWNHWMKVHSGLEAAQVIGRKITDLFPELITRHLEGHFHRALKGEVSVLSTALHNYLIPLAPVSRETDFQWMRQTARVAPLGSHNDIQGVIIVIEDVTQREWQSATLRKQHARDEILSWALAHLLKADDPRRVSRDLFCKIAAYADFDSYLLYLIDPSKPVFRLSAVGGLSVEAEESIRVVPLSQVPWISSASDGKPLIRDYTQIQEDPTFAIAKKLGFHAYVVLPLIAGSNLLGFLSFATRSRQNISAGESDLLGTIAQYLAVSLNRERTDRELRDAQKKLGDHAQELEAKVAERTSSLKQIIAELQTFSYTVAHDLRAPIRALKGYCEALLEDFSADLPAEATDVIGKLHRASVRLDLLTRDLLEFSKVSRQDIHLTPVEVEPIIEEVLASLGPPAASAVTVLRPLHKVFAQRTLASQCVANLIDNALKFVAEDRAPKITIWSEVVSASVRSDPSDTTLFTRSRYSLQEKDDPSESNSSRIRIWFEDEGIGIPTEVTQKIFGIFERAVDPNQFEGTGIGLAIVARAMERMGGNCGVESQPGAPGSRFWLEFQIPRNQAPTLS